MTIKKPNVIIIGSAKCGTTTLASILEAHPDVCMSRPKEISFFQDTIDFKPNPNYEKGWPWYQKAFSHYNGEKLVCEATPSYSDRSRSPNTAKHIYEFNPDMKIIYMVRNPLLRQISGWKMWYALALNIDKTSSEWKLEHEWAAKGFDFWMKRQKEVKQWDVNRYSYNLEAYTEFFSSAQIHVSFLEDWQKDQATEVSKVFKFLGLDSADQSMLNKKENTAGAKLELTSLAKNLPSNKFVSILKSVTPSFLKKSMVKKFIFKDIQYPNINYNSEMILEFKDYVKNDSESFLKMNNKPLNFWNE